MTKPIFVDLNGHTARVDPQSIPTGYIKLTLQTLQEADETGYIVHRGQVAEVYITADQADQLAEALRKGRHHDA